MGTRGTSSARRRNWCVKVIRSASSTRRSSRNSSVSDGPASAVQAISGLAVEVATFDHELDLAEGFDVVGRVVFDGHDVGQEPRLDGAEATVQPEGLGGDGGCGAESF